MAGERDNPKDSTENWRGAPGRRRTRLGSVSTQTGAARQAMDEALADGDPYPGEAEPLSYTPGRGVVTAAEALGVLRRRRRTERLQSPKRAGSAPAELPTTLDAWETKKQPTILRMPPTLMAYVAAKCEIEDTNPTAVIEELLGGWVMDKPRDPERARAKQLATIERLRRWAPTQPHARNEGRPDGSALT